MSDKANVIAIDGPAASGKSTVANRIAEKLGAVYINTGNMYRAVTLAALRSKINLKSDKIDKSSLGKLLSKTSIEYRIDGKGIAKLFLNGKLTGTSIRSPKVAKFASRIATIPEVREWLVRKQKNMASDKTLVVMEGRDIGTVVFPNAKFKFFLTASPEVRAKRRLEQDGETSEGSTIASVAAEIAERDRMDMNRKVAPLTKAEDAEFIDSSNMTIDKVVNTIVSRIQDTTHYK